MSVSLSIADHSIETKTFANQSYGIYIYLVISTLNFKPFYTSLVIKIILKYKYILSLFIQTRCN